MTPQHGTHTAVAVLPFMPKEPHTIPKEPPITEPPVKDPQPYKDPPQQPTPEPGPDVPLTDPRPPQPTM